MARKSCRAVLAEDASNPLVVHLPALTLQFGGDARTAVGGELQRDQLDGVAEIDVPNGGDDLGVEAVEGGVADARKRSHLLDRQWALPLLFFVDFPADGGVGICACDFRSSSICRKQAFKKIDLHGLLADLPFQFSHRRLFLPSTRAPGSRASVHEVYDSKRPRSVDLGFCPIKTLGFRRRWLFGSRQSTLISQAIPRQTPGFLALSYIKRFRAKCPEESAGLSSFGKLRAETSA